MSSNVTFDEVLDAIELLPPAEQEDLVAVMQRRLAERGRQRVVLEVEEGLQAFRQGKVRPAGVDDIMREIDR